MNKTRIFQFVAVQAICLVFPVMMAAQEEESLNLKQAVEKALQNSREVAQAQLQYDVSRRAVDVNRAVFKPNLYTGSGIAYTHGFPQTVSGAAPSIVNLSYVQTVFSPLMTAEVRAAVERSEAQRLALEKGRNQAMFQTRSAYLEL